MQRKEPLEFSPRIQAVGQQGTVDQHWMLVGNLAGPTPSRAYIHSHLRKIIKTRGHFPSDDAATKLIWLALRNITADWGRAAKEWREAMNQFAIAYGDRFTKSPA